MNHRRGTRWQTKLSIRVTRRETTSSLPAKLLELSHNGARIRLYDLISAPGEVIDVSLPDMNIPLQAMVMHTDKREAGLLWIDREAWLNYLQAHPIANLPLQEILMAS